MVAVQPAKVQRHALVAGCIIFVLTLVYILQAPSRGALPLNRRPGIPPRPDLLFDVYNETLGFEKILVLNLPSRTDRRDANLLASKYTGLEFERLDGVSGADVNTKALPPGGSTAFNSPGSKGSWRGHLNALQRIVEEGWETALILEDDADWDLRLKDQMLDLSRGVQVLGDRYKDPASILEQPAAGEDLYIGPDLTRFSPRHSPYGEHWDLLWLGHCGTRFPTQEEQLPRSRALITEDPTVPEPRHLVMERGPIDTFKTTYPNHTRVFHHTVENACSLAYAVTQRTARQILYHLSLASVTAPFDVSLRNFCDGEGRARKCWTATPTYFDQYRPVGHVGGQSDITNDGEGREWNPVARTNNVRWAVKVNLERLVEGEASIIDQWPNAE